MILKSHICFCFFSNSSSGRQTKLQRYSVDISVNEISYRQVQDISDTIRKFQNFFNMFDCVFFL